MMKWKMNKIRRKRRKMVKMKTMLVRNRMEVIKEVGIEKRGIYK